MRTLSLLLLAFALCLDAPPAFAEQAEEEVAEDAPIVARAS